MSCVFQHVFSTFRLFGGATMYSIPVLLALAAPMSPIPTMSYGTDVSSMSVLVDSRTGGSTSRDTGNDTYAGRDAQKSNRDEGKKEPGGDEQPMHHRSVSPSHLGPQGGSTADSGKAKQDQAAQAEQEAAKSRTPR
jgi:hypothetical protein